MKVVQYHLVDNVVTKNWVNIGSGNGLLPDGTKPFPGLMLIHHRPGPVTIIRGKFTEEIPRPSVTEIDLKNIYLNFIQISQASKS